MSLNNTPKANRLHIGIFGRRNAGKSSLINALTGQNLAIVSDTPGTTADPVFKSMELHPIGPVVFIDTAGFDDEGELGQLRVARTEEVIKRTDIAILVITADDAAAGGALDAHDSSWMKRLHEAGIPTITVFNKIDTLTEAQRDAAAQVANDAAQSSDDAIFVSAKTGEGMGPLRAAIIKAVPEESLQEQLLGDLIDDGSLVLLIMPQDIQAPKGRLILPQVQTIRELLDRRCTVVSATADGYEAALRRLHCPPDLIITDSQCFSQVYEKKPADSKLTSFSILMAAAKGDLGVFVDGVSAIDQAHGTFRVLIAEACTHVPLKEDIGTVKIPMLLRKQFGDQVEITNVRGNDFPQIEELKQYDLIIHCGACMFNRRHVLSRIAAAQEAGVPITNYGIFLAHAAGILDKIQF